MTLPLTINLFKLFGKHETPNLLQIVVTQDLKMEINIRKEKN